MIPPLPAPFNANIWLQRCLETAPRVPLALLRVAAACLANPKAGSDELLFLADALEETARCAAFHNRTHLIRDLRLLADLPRNEASLRARVVIPVHQASPASIRLPGLLPPNAETEADR